MKRVQLTLDEKTLTYLRGLVESGECASLSHAVRKIVGHCMREEEKRAGNPKEADGDEEGQSRDPSAARCPGCGEELTLRRVDDLRVVEYRAQLPRLQVGRHPQGAQVWRLPRPPALRVDE